MSIKALLNDDGSLICYWPNSEQQIKIPTTAVSVDDETLKKLLTGDWALVNEKLTAYVPSLEKLQATKLSEINTAAQAAADALVANYPGFEQLTWAKQQAECAAWYAADEADRTASLVPWCAACATARGVDLPAFMELVKTNVDAFMAVSAQIAGKRQRLAAAIYAVTDDDAGRTALGAIVWDESGS